MTIAITLYTFGRS